MRLTMNEKRRFKIDMAVELSTLVLFVVMNIIMHSIIVPVLVSTGISLVYYIAKVFFSKSQLNGVPFPIFFGILNGIKFETFAIFFACVLQMKR